ncbi:EI24-domain-containing protein [Neolentinus lepideus HHB14362 ss-1]|uniref:EI24-domain-containing protein n=1 Tax=Neolentinus lepideus HHB14362 ss-1 TaxID=1314782 RepID=A0A165TCM1_9AGAM|nr:EI24-domain-containing protein [Neolentinus lepideus HHB14362 ss-1]
MSRHPTQRASHDSYSPNPPYSARAAYPSFIPVQDTLILQATWAFRGLMDAFRWDIVVLTVTSDPEIRANFLKSLLLNSLSLTSIYVFDLLLQPLVQNQQKWLHRNVGWFYQVLWLLPVLGASLYLNSSWCTLIAKRTYALRHGSRATTAEMSYTYTGILNALATSAYRGVMIVTSVALDFALAYIPVVGPFVSFAFLCWVDAYYCFEFIWTARGLALFRRVRHLEEHWAYYFAFGLPSAALCMWGSGLANAAIFALIFPAYIIMAMHAQPVPQDPYRPLPTTDSGSDSRPLLPSPYIPIRLPVFSLVILINDWIVKVLGFVGGGAGRRGPGHRRGLSEAEVESVEEGVEMTGMRRGGRIGVRSARRKVE